MRMLPCPHCGAQNSVRRNVCYQCRQSLAGLTEERSTPREHSAPVASSRWEAIEPLRGRPRKRGPQPAQEAGSSPAGPAPALVERPRARYRPAARRSLGHVRRMSMFFQELHTMTRSGIAVASACRELERRAPKQLRPVAGEMTRAVESGQPLSSVMERHQHLFYPWHLGLVGAAEAGGFLPEAFEHIAHAYEVEWETRSALRLRLFFYVFFGLPAVLLVLPVIGFLKQPIPRIDDYTQQWVIDSLLKQFYTSSVPIASGLVTAWLLWQFLNSTAWFQGLQQRVVIRLPVIGQLAQSHALDRYLATLGLMLRGGIPLAQAAEHAALAAGHAELTPRLLAIVPALREGAPLSQTLASERLLDTETLSMTATGETSGSLPDMLARAASYYRRENEGKRRMLLRTAGVAVGVAWLSIVGAVLITGYLRYFDFLFRAGDQLWMER